MTWYFIAVFFGIIVGFFLGILIMRYCPAMVAWCTTPDGQAATQAGEVDARPAGKVLPHVGAITKYALRFGIPLAGLIALIAILKPENIALVLYKICLILIGFTLCELIWVFSYKPVFGKIEELQTYEKRTVLIFRGVLYLAIVLGITWGL